MPCPESDNPCLYDDCVCQGCTPGYWKQEQHLGNWSLAFVYPLLDTNDDLFGAHRYGGYFGDTTFLEVLWTKGGGLNALARQAVAAVLNVVSYEINYCLGSIEMAYAYSDIVDTTNDAFGYMLIVGNDKAKEFVKNFKNEFEMFNEERRPLGRAELED